MDFKKTWLIHNLICSTMFNDLFRYGVINGVGYFINQFFTLPEFWAHRACDTAASQAGWLLVGSPLTRMGIKQLNHATPLDFWYVLDQMDRIMIVNQVILQGLWRSNVSTIFQTLVFQWLCAGKNTFWGHCASYDGLRSCNYTVWLL